MSQKSEEELKVERKVEELIIATEEKPKVEEKGEEEEIIIEGEEFECPEREQFRLCPF